MRNSKNAFTLVELIVVITILSILGTIAFISLQGYTADARNTKRIQNVKEILKSIEVKVSGGASIKSFITADTNNQLANTNKVAGAAIVVGTDYQSGIPNYTALGVKSDDFKDSSGDDYRIGLTTKKDGQYEMAAVMENGAGAKSAKVLGTYEARTQSDIEVTIAGTKVTLTNISDINKFKRGDTVTDTGGTNTAEVINISADGSTLTIKNAGTALTGSKLKLAADEVAGLIEAKDGANDNPVIEGSTANLPY